MPASRRDRRHLRTPTNAPMVWVRGRKGLGPRRRSRELQHVVGVGLAEGRQAGQRRCVAQRPRRHHLHAPGPLTTTRPRAPMTCGTCSTKTCSPGRSRRASAVKACGLSSRAEANTLTSSKRRAQASPTDKGAWWPAAGWPRRGAVERLHGRILRCAHPRHASRTEGVTSRAHPRRPRLRAMYRPDAAGGRPRRRAVSVRHAAGLARDRRAPGRRLRAACSAPHWGRSAQPFRRGASSCSRWPTSNCALLWARRCCGSSISATLRCRLCSKGIVAPGRLRIRQQAADLVQREARALRAGDDLQHPDRLGRTGGSRCPALDHAEQAALLVEADARGRQTGALDSSPMFIARLGNRLTLNFNPEFRHRQLHESFHAHRKSRHPGPRRQAPA